MILNKQLADALCAVITLGFIKKNMPNGSVTSFIYEEPGDKIAHDNLITLLKKYIPEFNKVEQQTDKAILPVIVSSKSGSYAKNLIDVSDNGWGQLIRKFEEELSTKFSFKKGKPELQGAYLGGLLTLSELKLNSPSVIYLRTRSTYLSVDEPSPTAVKTSFNKAAAVQEYLQQFLKENARFPHTGDSKIHITYVRGYDKDGTSYGPYFIPKSIQEHQVFASCHGLINAMFYYTPGKTEEVVEYALGNATCKIASCLPCSLFASSQEKPATATHFGRGDNWNFPEEKFIQPYFKGMIPKWKEYIRACYELGNRLIPPPSPRYAVPGNITKLHTAFADVPEEAVPDIFLDALTFEGKFIDKITTTLKS